MRTSGLLMKSVTSDALGNTQVTGHIQTQHTHKKGKKPWRFLTTIALREKQDVMFHLLLSLGDHGSAELHTHTDSQYTACRPSWGTSSEKTLNTLTVLNACLAEREECLPASCYSLLNSYTDGSWDQEGTYSNALTHTYTQYSIHTVDTVSLQPW